jgi:hypothetical protein
LSSINYFTNNIEELSRNIAIFTQRFENLQEQLTPRVIARAAGHGPCECSVCEVILRRFTLGKQIVDLTSFKEYILCKDKTRREQILAKLTKNMTVEELNGLRGLIEDRYKQAVRAQGFESNPKAGNAHPEKKGKPRKSSKKKNAD